MKFREVVPGGETPKSHWSSYIEKTRNAKPSPLLRIVMNGVKEKTAALDLGAGALNDSKFLLRKGFEQVDAVDSEPEIRKIAEKESLKGLVAHVMRIEDFQFRSNSYDLINAQYVLPYIQRTDFFRVMDRLKQSLKPGGVFTGNFYGVKDEWNAPGAQATFLTHEEMQQLFDEMEVLRYVEFQQSGKTVHGEEKFWHVYNIAARKRIT